MTFDELALAMLVETVNSLPAAAAMIAATWLTLRMARGLSARARYAAWWICLAAVLAAPFVRIAGVEETAPAAPHELTAEPETAVIAAGAPSAPVSVDGDSMAPPIAILWALGAIAGLARIVASYWWLRRRRARSWLIEDSDRWQACLERCPVRRGIELRASDEIRTPMAAGFPKRMILLPAQLPLRLSEREIEDVVVHELAHIARGDHWAQLFERMLAAVLWFHPAVHWILARIGVEREHCCDERVVRTGAAAAEYAASLVKLIELRQTGAPLLASTAASGRSQVAQRVEALLRKTPAAGRLLSAAAMGVAIALIGMGAISSPAWPGFLALAVEAAAPPAENDPAPPASRPGFLAALKAAGMGSLSVEEIIDMKNSGVSADYLRDIRAIHAMGYGPYSPKQIIELHRNGVGLEFFEALKANGLRRISAGEAAEAKNHGVDGKALRDAGQYGANLTIRQIIRLKSAGVI